MENSNKTHSCKTCLAVCFAFDREKNAELLRRQRECAPEQIGIVNKEEVERELRRLTDDVVWDRHRFVLGLNARYDVYVSEMLRVTLRDLFGKEERLRDICRRYDLTATLEIVPQIAAAAEEPAQCLSLDRDIVEFLYKSGAELDLDYSVI